MAQGLAGCKSEMTERVFDDLNPPVAIHRRKVKPHIGKLPVGRMSQVFRRGPMNALHLRRAQACNGGVNAARLLDLGKNHLRALTENKINLAPLPAP